MSENSNNKTRDIVASSKNGKNSEVEMMSNTDGSGKFTIMPAVKEDGDGFAKPKGA